MAKNTNETPKQNNAWLNLIVVVIIAVFVVAGVYATYGKVAQKLEDKAIVNGTKAATVEYLARQSNMTTEDYLAQFGLTLGDAVTKDSTESDMLDNMTIENYLKYNGGTETADEVIEGTGLTDKVTKDTLWKDFLPQVPTVSVMGEEGFNAAKEQFGLGDDVTLDMPYGEFEAKVIAAQENLQSTGTEQASAE